MQVQRESSASSAQVRASPARVKLEFSASPAQVQRKSGASPVQVRRKFSASSVQVQRKFSNILTEKYSFLKQIIYFCFQDLSHVVPTRQESSWMNSTSCGQRRNSWKMPYG